MGPNNRTGGKVLRACGEAQDAAKRSEEGESREHFMGEEIFELGPAGGESLRMEKKEISQVRSAGNKGRTGRKCR